MLATCWANTIPGPGRTQSAVEQHVKALPANPEEKSSREKSSKGDDGFPEWMKPKVSFPKAPLSIDNRRSVSRLSHQADRRQVATMKHDDRHRRTQAYVVNIDAEPSTESRHAANSRDARSCRPCHNRHSRSSHPRPTTSQPLPSLPSLQAPMTASAETRAPITQPDVGFPPGFP